MSGFPSSTDSFAGYTAGETLLAANNAAQLNQIQAATVAIENKVGLGASTPTSGVALVGNGTGTSTWGQISLTTGVSGILPVSNGGNGTSTSTGTGSNVLNTNPILNNPTTTDLVNTGGLSNTGGITNIGGIQNVNGLTTDTLTVNNSTISTPNGIASVNGNHIWQYLGSIQTTANFSTTSATAVQVTGQTVTVTVPSGYTQVRITVSSRDFYNTGSSVATIPSIWRGTVSSGTQIAQALINGSSGGSVATQLTFFGLDTPGAGPVTYNLGMLSGGTGTIEAGSGYPLTMLVECC